MLYQVVLPRPRNVSSEINPFLLGPVLALCCPVTSKAEAIPNFLDFFPIWPKLTTSEELFIGDKINVMRRIGGANQEWRSYINQ